MNRPRVVVEAGSPRRRAIVLVVAAVVVLLLLFVTYEMGQRRAGFNRLASIDEATGLQTRVAEQDAEIRALHEQEAILKTAAQIDKEAYGQVESELVGLQAKVSELEENLEFYRGIVSPDDTKGVQIQDLRITALGAPGKYRVQVYLTQALRSDRPIAGSVHLRVAGQSAGKPVELAFADLLTDSGLEAPERFRFLYFQQVIAEIALPKGFEPENVIVEARPDGKKAKTVEESYFWEIKGE